MGFFLASLGTITKSFVFTSYFHYFVYRPLSIMLPFACFSFDLQSKSQALDFDISTRFCHLISFFSFLFPSNHDHPSYPGLHILSYLPYYSVWMIEYPYCMQMESVFCLLYSVRAYKCVRITWRARRLYLPLPNNARLIILHFPTGDGLIKITIADGRRLRGREQMPEGMGR